jgi:hypothetical protein
MRWAIVLVSTTAIAAAAPPPKDCGVYAESAKGDPSPTQITGTVKSITARKDPPGWVDVVVTTATGERTFGLAIVPVKPPFAVGSKIDVNLRRGGGWHQVYDAVIKDGAGKILAISSGSGADDWADGWKVTRGKVTETDPPHPDAKTESVNRTHALDFERGKTKVTVLPNKCTLVKDGTDSFIVSGSGTTWLGLRPPEGVDYQSFSMLRWQP